VNSVSLFFLVIKLKTCKQKPFSLVALQKYFLVSLRLIKLNIFLNLNFDGGKFSSNMIIVILSIFSYMVGGRCHCSANPFFIYYIMENWRLFLTK